MDNQNENRFDTLTLLSGLTDEDAKNSGFSLEDILKEFGGGADPEPETAETAPGEEIPAATEKAEDDGLISQIQRAIDHEMEMTSAVPDPVIRIEEPEPERQEEKPLSEADLLLQRHGIRLVTKDVKLPPQQSGLEQTAPIPRIGNVSIQDVDSPGKQKAAKTKKKKKARMHLVRDEDLPTAEELLAKTAKKAAASSGSFTLVLICMLFSGVWTVLCGWKGLLSDKLLQGKIPVAVLLAAMLLAAIPVRDYLKKGISDLCTFRFTERAHTVLAALVCLICGAFSGKTEQLPPCFAVCVIFFFLQWKRTLYYISIRRALKPFVKSEEWKYGVSVEENVYEGASATVHDSSLESDHVRGVLSTGSIRSKESFLVLPVIAVSLALAMVAGGRRAVNILWCWSCLLALSVPACGMISFFRPYAASMKKHKEQGIIFSGQYGVEYLHQAGAVIIQDDDLFPSERIRLDGVKLYENLGMGIAAAFAAAVMETAGSGLAPLFRELRDKNNGPEMRVSQFRRYEGGGFGAEIGGDVLLLGSRRFMQLMGVDMLADADIQSAVYMSLNGKLAAVFVINYRPNSKNRKALRRLMNRTSFQPVFATRDFMLTPAMVERYFKVPVARLEFPGAEERSRLAALPGDTVRSRGAVLNNDSFETYATAVVDADLLFTTAKICRWISIGISLTMAALFFVLIMASEIEVSCLTVVILSVISVLPGFLITGKGVK